MPTPDITPTFVRHLLRIAALAALFSATASAPATAAAPRIAGYQNGTYAIQHARLFVTPDEIIEDGTLLIRDGLIVEIGTDVAVPDFAEVIDGKGLVVYAGFIDAGNASLIDSKKNPEAVAGRDVDFGRYVLAATRPDNRRGLTPEYHLRDGLTRDEKSLDTLRKQGITAVHAVPDGRIAAGQSVLLALNDYPLRESVLSEPVWSAFQLFAPGGDAYPSTLMGATAHLRQAFLDAAQQKQHRELYAKRVDGIGRPAADPVLEALQDVQSGASKPVFLAESRDDIHRALNFAEEHGLNAVLCGGQEVHRCLDRLKQTQTDVVLELDFGKKPEIETDKATDKLQAEIKDPLRVQEHRLKQWRERVGGLAKLHEAGIRFAVATRGLKDAEGLLDNLRAAVKEGLSPVAGLTALTVDAADVLGAGEHLGTLKSGKLAHVVVMSGPWEDASSRVRYVFVDGVKHEYNKDKSESSGDQDASGNINVAGRWDVEIETGDSKTSASVDIQQDKAKLRGTFRSAEADGRVTSGRIKQDSLEWVVSIGAGDRDVELRFEGTFDASEETLSGTLKTPFGAPTKWTARRPEADETSEDPKVKLTLDTSEAGGDKDSDGKSKARHDSVADMQPTELDVDRIKRPRGDSGNLLIKNATVLTGTGETLPETSLLIRDGKIAAIGADVESPEDIPVVDARGLYAMPGIIDTHSHIMITAGINENSQSIVPEVRVRDVVNSDDAAEYRALAGGVTAARLFHGSANVIGGQDAVVKLKHGATAREHILHDAPQGVKFALGENVKFRTTRFPNTRMGVEATLQRAFLEAVDYRRQWMQYEKASQGEEAADLLPPRRDLRLEALADIVNHEKFIHSHCYRADEILMLLRVTSNLGIRVWSLQHVLEGYKIAPEIVAHGASCSTFSDWWAYKVEAYDATPFNAALLQEAGANVVIKSDDAELIRHLYQEAAKTLRYGGMSPEAALQTITRNPARELGLGDRMGTLEVGKDGDVALFNGHPLSALSRCEMTVVEGVVCFERASQPTAMSAAQRERSRSAPELVLPGEDIRARTLNLDAKGAPGYAIVDATVHPVDGPVIEKGTVLIEGDNIAAIGSRVSVPEGFQVIFAGGLHVFPGIIDAGTTLGLVEIGKVRETLDSSESGTLQPDLRAGVAVNRDSELIPAARAGGITTVLVRPTSGIISGQASLMQLAGWTAPEMILDYEAGLQMDWPTGSNAKQQVEKLKEMLAEGRQYAKAREAAKSSAEVPAIADPRLDALAAYLRGEKPVFVEAHSRKAIAEALLFAEEEKLKIIITGGTDAWKLADELKKRDVPVIVGAVMRRPTEAYDPFDAPYANAAHLHDAGVQFCIRSDDASNCRNSPFEAAMAVAYGLPEEAALRSVTLAAAEVLGLESAMGSLTAGKRANVVIADGSLLQPTTQIKGVFVKGRPFRPESRQTRFYEEYRRRLHEAEKVKAADVAGE